MHNAPIITKVISNFSQLYDAPFSSTYTIPSVQTTKFGLSINFHHFKNNPLHTKANYFNY